MARQAPGQIRVGVDQGPLAVLGRDPENRAKSPVEPFGGLGVLRQAGVQSRFRDPRRMLEDMAEAGDELTPFKDSRVALVGH